MRFTIRDVLWLTVVVALAVGWWIDRGRIQTERQSVKAAEKTLADEIAKLQVLSLRHARAMVDVAEAELASMQDIKQRNPGAVSDAEMRSFEAQVEVARVSLERAAAKDAAKSNPATAAAPNGPGR